LGGDGLKRRNVFWGVGRNSERTSKRKRGGNTRIL